MKPLDRSIQHATALLLALVGIAAGGCAMNELPRIDPTGQRLLVFPGEPTPAIAPLPQAAAPTLPPGAVASLPAVPGNVEAPPVYTDPYLPGPGGPTTTPSAQSVVVGPPVAATTGQPVTIAAPVAGEALSISPSRVLAPIGSEVILIGGVCAENGYLRTNERIEWMLDRAGTGQIVTVGGRNELDMFRLPQNTPRKIDNYFAVGSTSPYADVLDRGTPSPNDDIEIRRGDAWISISSPAEGTSYVTAYAPNVANWAGRTARATIYWVDAQWAFPPSVTLAPSENHTLTTTVTRQSDGAPIAGWIVRYRVAGGGAGLGYGRGQTSDVPTDNQGRASVDIAPTDDRPGTTNIEVEIIRPEQAGVAASPRVTLGRAVSVVTWAAGGISGTPMPSTFPPVDSSPIGPPAADGWQSPTPTPTPSPSPTPTPAPEPTPAAGTPDLSVEIEQRTPGATFRVGDTVDYLITVTNRGSGTARNVKVVDEFDIGLETDIAEPGIQVFSTKDFPFDLAPGESRPLPIVTFRIKQPGRLSHSVTATADNAVNAFDRADVNVEAEASIAPPTLRVSMDGPIRGTVGEVARFKIRVENVGSVPAQNVVVSTTRDPEMTPVGADPNKAYDEVEFRSTGTIRWVTPELAPQASETYEFECRFLTPIQTAFARATVTADGLTTPQQDEWRVEIRPQLGGEITAPPLGGVPPSTKPAGFDISVTPPAGARVGNRSLIYVRLRNTSGAVQQNVQLRVLIPPTLQADFSQVQSTATAEPADWGVYGTALLVGPIAEMAPGEEFQVTVPVDALQQGRTKIVADVSSAALQPTDDVQEMDILPR